MNLDARVFVAGSRGLVGSAIVRRLEAAGATRLLTATRDQLDLRDQAAVSYWFRAKRSAAFSQIPPGPRNSSTTT
jgi:GDP-L-fucose synthase